MSAGLEADTAPGAGRERPGLHGPGSRARSRDLGYADAMYDVFSLVQELEQRLRDPIDAVVTLDRVRAYAFDAYMMGRTARVSLDQMNGWIGQWRQIAPPAL